MPPVDDGRWRLYDLAVDPGETRDLAGDRPELMREMLKDYAAYEARVGVATLPPGYTTQQQLMANALDRQKGSIAIIAGSAVALVLAGLGFLLLRRRKAQR